jgi:DDE superfamily endonuclease
LIYYFICLGWQINTWIIAPYKAPERNQPDNEVFNNHVSILRIRSEHAIGFLKGRFQSLKNLRLHIKDRISHVIGTYWVAACIGIHAFAVRHEAEEKCQDPDFDKLADNQDPFIDEGLTSTSGSDLPAHSCVRMPTRLQLAKRQREKLKEKLFRSKVKRMQRVAQERRSALGADISESSSESL